jgi:hypothetical protein
LFNNLENHATGLIPPDAEELDFVRQRWGRRRELCGSRAIYLRCPDSERWEVDRIIREEAEAAGIKPHIFNQCQWQGTTGWEFWTANTVAILAVATRVAERLGVPCDTSALSA